MAGGKEHAGMIGTGATGHGLPIREHRGREEVKATSPRPRTWPEDTADAVVAMAGGAEVPGAHG